MRELSRQLRDNASTLAWRACLCRAPQCLEYGHKTMLGINLETAGCGFVASGPQFGSLAAALCPPERMRDDDDLPAVGDRRQTGDDSTVKARPR